MDFTIRAASTSDVAAMQEVRSKVIENRLSDPHSITEASFLPYLESGSIWVAEADGTVVGFAALNAPMRSVWALFVDPKAEGTGIGRALLRRMIAWAKEQRLLRLTLSTEKGTRAAQFYKRAGWTEVATSPVGEASFEISLSR